VGRWETRGVFQGRVGHACCAWSTVPAASTGQVSRRRSLRPARCGRSRRRRVPLEVDRRHVDERGMAEGRVVRAFDELEDRGAGVARRAERHPIEEFALQRREEALAHRSVVAIADRAHRRPDVRVATAAPEFDRRVLAALVGMMNHPGRPSLRNPISRAARTRPVRRCVAIAQPTIRRLQTSSTTARYSVPMPVGM